MAFGAIWRGIGLYRPRPVATGGARGGSAPLEKFEPP